jgi:hypothetical protein
LALAGVKVFGGLWLVGQKIRSGRRPPPRRAARRQRRRRGSACSLAAPRRPGLGQRPCSKARVKFSSRDSLPRRTNVRRNVRFGGSVVEVREDSTVELGWTATVASGNLLPTPLSTCIPVLRYSGQVRPPSLRGAPSGPVWACSRA